MCSQREHHWSSLYACQNTYVNGTSENREKLIKTLQTGEGWAQINLHYGNARQQWTARLDLSGKTYIPIQGSSLFGSNPDSRETYFFCTIQGSLLTVEKKLLSAEDSKIQTWMLIILHFVDPDVMEVLNEKYWRNTTKNRNQDMPVS